MYCCVLPPALQVEALVPLHNHPPAAVALHPSAGLHSRAGAALEVWVVVVVGLEGVVLVA